MSRMSGAEGASENGLANKLLSDAVFGKYTLIAKIGHGGMAEVFLAAIRGPASFTKLCVLKRLHPHLEDDERLVGMFLDEARLAARLNHPNVVQTYEVGDIAGLHFLTMEYLEGQAFSRVMRALSRQNMQLPLNIAIKFFLDVLDGLEYAHNLKDFDGSPLHIVHRDISPANIFVTYEGQSKLLDFGIARATTQTVETRAGQVKGKFAYIAPEQAAPDSDHDRRVDLWAFGVVMWETLAGRRLFKGESEVITLQNALNSEILRLDESADGIPLELAEIVDRALQRNREERYASAYEMREDLAAFARDAGLSATRHEVGRFVSELFAREQDEQRRVLGAFMRGDSPGHVMVPASVGTSSHSGLKARHEVLGSEPSGLGTMGEPQSLSDFIADKTEDSENVRRGVLFGAIALVAVLAAVLAFLWPSSSELAEPPPGTAETTHPTAATERAGEVLPPEGANEGRAPEGPAAERAAEETDDSLAAEADVLNADDGLESDDPEEASDDDSPAARRARRIARNRARRRQRERQNAEASEMAEEVVEPQGDGFLSLSTTPIVRVRENGRMLGSTPILRESLSPGWHVFTLSNPAEGIERDYRVLIRSGQHTTRRVDLR